MVSVCLPYFIGLSSVRTFRCYHRCKFIFLVALALLEAPLFLNTHHSPLVQVVPELMLVVLMFIFELLVLICYNMILPRSSVRHAHYCAKSEISGLANNTMIHFLIWSCILPQNSIFTCTKITRWMRPTFSMLLTRPLAFPLHIVWKQGNPRQLFLYVAA